MAEGPLLSVGVVTRNRPNAVVRCVESLQLLGDVVSEIIVVDDLSDTPVSDLFTQLRPSLAEKLRVVRQKSAEGPIVARNSIMRLARSEYVLSLDDDAYVLDGVSVTRAVGLMDRFPRVGAVAFAQAEADGSPWPAGMQPARVTYPCTVPAYIGFAHLVRRAAFHEVGGYHEALHFYGEEKDLCVRLWNAGYEIVYLPDVLVAHVPDPGGRSPVRYVRYAIRNDCLFALYNEPLPLPLVSVPLRLSRYFSMIRGHEDPGGFAWIVRDVARNLPSILRARRAVTWTTMRRWREVQRTAPAFPVAETA